jgi:tetratricopeptide (TPR) repeat protein
MEGRADAGGRSQPGEPRQLAGAKGLVQSACQAIGIELVIGYLERALRWTVKQHFRIPLGLFWTALLAGAALAFFIPAPWIVIPILLSIGGIDGILRRRRYRRGANFLVVPQPVTVGDDDPLAARAQQLIMESLAQRLTAEEMRLVRPIPARLGPTDIELAAAISRRLGAFRVVVGRVDKRADGGWTLFSGLVSPPDRGVTHLDPHTRDKLPARASWAAAIDYLSSTRDVQDVQDPLLVSRELEALVRALAGYVADLSDDLGRAEREFRSAIGTSESNSHPIDELRCALAGVLVRQDRRSEAIDELRARAARDDPSPGLLRALARYLRPQPGEFREHLPYAGSAEDQVEAIAALRRAAASRADPMRPMTLYNLSQILPTEGERREALAEAMAQSRFYRQAWYTHKALGAMDYHAAVAQQQAGDELAARNLFRSAAREYRAAIRRRPKLRVWWYDAGRRYPYARFPSSPVLHANAQDACEGARQRLGARWHARRTDRLRKARLKRAGKQFDRGLWLHAYANYDFAIIGRHDFSDAYAQVMRAICLQQEGHLEEAAADFEEANERFPGLALAIRGGCAAPGTRPLPNGLPGPYPTDPEEIVELLRESGVAPPD